VAFSPVLLASAPAQKLSAPAQMVSAPAQISSAPAQIPSAPAHMRPAPAQVPAAPARKVSAGRRKVFAERLEVFATRRTVPVEAFAWLAPAEELFAPRKMRIFCIETKKNSFKAVRAPVDFLPAGPLRGGVWRDFRIFRAFAALSEEFVFVAVVCFYLFWAAGADGVWRLGRFCFNYRVLWLFFSVYCAENPWAGRQIPA
jgi:hypothetical protein